MRKKLKKGLALLLSAAMVFGMMPVSASATETEPVAIEQATSNVAEIDGTEYATLADAIKNAGAEAEITLLKSVTLEDTLTIPAGKKIVLDLAGYTISQVKECDANYAMIYNKGDLTITGNGKISLEDNGSGDPNYGWGTYTVRNDGTLVVENGTIEHLGVQTAHMYCAIFQYSGSTTINGGTISTPKYRSVRLWKGDMTINGGTFEGRVWVQPPDNTSKLTITGGTFDATKEGDAYAVYVSNQTYGVDFAVKGGTFKDAIGANVPSKLAETIKGGTFTEEAVKATDVVLLKEGLAFVPNGGNYGVGEKQSVAEVAGEKFETLKDAVAAANAAGEATITLNQDVTVNEKLTISGNVTISGNKTITRADNYTGTLFEVNAGATLTLDNGLVIDGGNNWTLNTELYNNALNNGATATWAELVTTEEDAPNATAAMFVVNGAVVANNVTIQNSYSSKESNGGDASIFKVIGADASLTMAGAQVKHVVTGGANSVAYLASGAKWTINGGTLISDTFAGRNGGVCRSDSGYIVMNGGEISNNRSVNTNGTVWMLYGGSFEMNGGKICSNSGIAGSDNSRCAAIYLHSSGKVIMNDGEICHNSGKGYGGIDVAKSSAELTINGGYVGENISSYADRNPSDVNVAAGKAEITGGTFTQDVSQWLAPNAGLTYDEETKQYTATNEVAAIGETTYTSLAEAIEAAEDGATVKVLCNHKVADTILVNKTITLDLNGKTISQSKACESSYEMINNKGNLTITGNGKISFTDTSEGDPSYGWGSYTIRNEGNLVVENGTIEHRGEQAEHMYCAIFQYCGSTTIKGGTISTPNYRSVRLWKGDMTIKGGTFEGQVWVQAVDNSSELAIVGGSFAPGGNDSSSVFVTNSTYDAKLTVSDGTFATKIGCSEVAKLAGCITGGTFKAAAVEYTSADLLAEGLVFTQLENGDYGLKPGAASVNGKAYETLQKAFEAANAAESATVTLLENVELNESIKVTGNVTLELNGKTITGIDKNEKGNFYLFNNVGTFTIQDTAVARTAGAITLVAETDRDWNASSVVVANNPGGKLTIKGGRIEHLGGTDMAYAIDNLTNGKGTYAETVIEGGTIKSTYRAVRQFLNGVEAQNILEITGGEITGENKAVFFHDPSTKANSGTLTIGKDAKVNGDVYLFVTAGSTEWPVEVSIAASAVNGEVLTANLPEGYRVVKGEDGTYGLKVATIYEVATKAELDAAIKKAVTGDIVKLTANIDYGTDQLAINKEITLDLGGNVLTTNNAYGGMSLKGNCTVKNGTIKHQGKTAAIKAWNVVSFENLVIDVAFAEEGKVIGGIVIQSGDAVRVGTIKNVTIKGDGLTNGIETYNCGNAEEVIGSMENVTIDAKGTGMLISAPCGTATNCDIKGGVSGIELWIKGTYSATLELVECKVAGGTQAIYVHDEFSSNPNLKNDGKLEITIDDATVIEGNPLTQTIARAEDVNVDEDITANAVAKANDTYYTTLEAAFAAANEAESATITLLEDVTSNTSFNVTGKVTLDLNGKKITGTDNSTGSYALINVQPGADFTVEGTGTITLKATNNRGWGGYSSVISNQRGTLTVNGGTIKHLGGTDMTYAIDNLTNGKGTKAVTVINDGNIISPYRAIRQFLNGVEADNTLTINGGTIIGTNKTVWVQDPSANANSGTLTISENAELYGDVYLYANPNSTDWPVEISIAKAAFMSGDVVCSDLPAGYAVTAVDGVYGVVTGVVAMVGKVVYTSFEDAFAAVEEGGTLTLLADVETSKKLSITKDMTIDGNGNKLVYTGSDRAIDVPNNASDKIDVTLQDLTVECSASYCERGISYNEDGKLTLNNVTVEGTNVTYALNLPGKSSNATVAINDSALTGCIALNVWGANSTITAVNSVFTSVDTETVENYGAIKLNNDGSTSAEGTVITITGGKIIAKDEKGAPSTAVGNATATGKVDVSASTEVIGTINKPVAIVTYAGTDNFYSCSTLQNAIDKAIETKGNVKLISDIELAETVKVTGTVTLDLNGKTITGTDSNEKGNFYLINNTGNLTITGNGTITLEAKTDRDWNASSVVVANNPGGKLTVESGTIKHLGGTDMAYAIDNLTNGKGTYAETIINGGTVKSTYRAIRQFLNGVEAQNILTINGGTIEGANKAVWAQDPSKAANSGTLTISANATLNGDVYLSVTEGSTEWPVEVSIAAAALAEGKQVLTSNLPEGYAVMETAGIYGVVTGVVAMVGEVPYTSLAEAFAAADGKTVTLVTDVEVTDTIKVTGTVTLDLNGKTISQTKACTASYSMIENEGNLTITGNGKISFTDTGAGDPNFGWGSYTLTNRGTLVVENGTIENLSTQNPGEGQSNVHMYCAIQQAAGTTTINGGTISNDTYRSVRVNRGEFVINGGKFVGQVWVQPFDDSTALTITGGSFEPTGNDGSSVYVENSAKDVAFAVSGGTFETKIGVADAEKLAGSITGGQFAELAKANTNTTLLKEGSAFGTLNAEGYCSLVEAGILVDHEVNGIKYFASIYDALDYIQPRETATIRLLDDVTITADQRMFSNYSIVINAEYITLDLNGKTMLFDYEGSQSTVYAAIALYNKATLTIIDSSEEQTGTIYNKSKIQGKDGPRIIWITSAGSATIEAGNFISEQGDTMFYTSNSNPDIPTTLYIKGGYFEHTIPTSGETYRYFNQQNGYQKQIIEVSGGTFAHNPTDSEMTFPEGWKASENEDGSWGVVEIKIAQIGDTTYPTLAKAIEAANAMADGATVTLLEDTTVDGTIKVTGNVTLDLNGKTVSGECNASQSTLFYVENGATLTVKDSVGEGMITYVAGTSNVGWTIDVKGNLVLESGTIELTGEWSIGYAVDVRPNAWGTAYTEPTTFVMNGGTIISSDGAVRVASSSSPTHTNVTASFVMNGGAIDAAWDGVFVQQSDAAWDVLKVEINGGTIESDLNPIRFYGPAATSYVAGEDCVDIALNGGTLTYTGTETQTWLVDGILRTGGGTDAAGFVNAVDFAASETFANNNVAEGYRWVEGTKGIFTLKEIKLEGEGTPESPFLIKTVEDLILFRDSVNAEETKYNADGVYVALAADIDLADVDWSVNIGDDCNATFDGIFDGKGHTISNLTSVETAKKADGYICTGLFGAIAGNAEIKNLTIENVTINTGDFVGNNVAAVVGFAYNCAGTIENVEVTGNISINAKNVTGVGAIVGYAYGGNLAVTDCTVDGNSGSTMTGAAYVGGIIGYAGGKVEVTDCTVRDLDVTATSCVAGGIAGIVLDGGVVTDNVVRNVNLTAENANWKNSAAIAVGTIIKSATVSAIYNKVTVNGAASDVIVGSEHQNKPTTPVAKVEARIGDVYYVTLEDALAAEGDEVTVLSTITIDAGETVTLDLNGKTVSYTSAADDADMIYNKGNLTITDSSAEKDGKLTFTYTGAANQRSNSTIVNAPGASVTVEAGTVENASGFRTNAYTYAIDSVTNGTLGATNVTITGGTVTSNYIGIRQFINSTTDNNTLTVTGGTVYGGRRAINIHNQKNDTCVTTITGGTISGGDYSLCAITETTNISVTGGDFTGSVWYSGTTGFISGGTFDEPVADEYCAEGYISFSTADGKYTVVEGTYVAQVGTVGYETLAAAIEAAGKGDTVTVLTNIALTETVKVAEGKEITLDLNGYTITGTPATAAGYSVIENKGNLTITGTGAIVCDHKLEGSTAYAVNTITNAGTLVIDGPTIENNSTATNQIGYAIDNNSTTADAIVVVEAGEVKASGSNYYDAIRQFCNSETNENSVTVEGGKVSSIWMQNPSDGSTDKNTKDVAGSVAITGGEVTGLYLEPSAKFEAEITGGTIGEVEYFQEADGRNLEGFISGGTFKSDFLEELCAYGYKKVENDDGTYGVEKDSTVTPEPTPGPTVAKIGDAEYDDVKKALADAAELAKDSANVPVTVTLAKMDGAVEAEGIVAVKNGVTLDLAGHSLTAEGLVAFKGANVIDSKIGADGSKTGILKVDSEMISLAEENSQLPVWNEKEGDEAGFIFATMDFSRVQINDLGEDTVAVVFKPHFGQKSIHTLLANGGEDNGLKVVLELTWERNGKDNYQKYVYKDVDIIDVYGNGMAFGLEISGFERLGIKGKVTTNIVIESDSGARVYGGDFTL